MSYTIRKLSEMTDEATFERLATAILREARLECALGRVPKARSSTPLPQSFVTTGNPDRSSASAR
jgi:hypothetical protein